MSNWSRFFRTGICAVYVLLIGGVAQPARALDDEGKNSSANLWLTRTWQTDEGLPDNNVTGVAQAIDGHLALSGTNIMELDPANATNDVLKSGFTITYGGTLNLVSLGALSGNSSFKLFSASSYLGSFSSITPATPGPGQAWDTSALGTTGTIKVVTTTPPSFGSIAIVGTSVVFSGSNGVASNPYYVLASTNVAWARTNWIRIATNTFDLNGNFAFTNSLTPPMPQRFYLLELP